MGHEGNSKGYDTQIDTYIYINTNGFFDEYLQKGHSYDFWRTQYFSERN